MGTNPPVSPNEHGDGSFEWLAHDPAPAANVSSEASHDLFANDTSGAPRDDPRPVDRPTPVPTHARLDPLTVQGAVNRVLVLVFCLIAVGATYETIGALSSSHVPRTTSVTPSLLIPTTAPDSGATTGTAKRSTTTARPATTTPPATSPTTVAAPMTTPRATTPPATTPPATFSRPVVPLTVPQTAPQTIQVPSTTPTTSPTGPSDTVAVPFK